MITVSEMIFHFPSLEKKRKSLRPFHCVVNMNVPLKLLVILQWRLSAYPFKLCKQIKLLQQYFLKSANQIDFIDVLSFPFRCSVKLRRLQLQAWHFEALSSLCDCIASVVHYASHWATDGDYFSYPSMLQDFSLLVLSWRQLPLHSQFQWWQTEGQAREIFLEEQRPFSLITWTF